MVYVVVEVCIYIMWAAVFFTRSKRTLPSATEELQVLLLALPTATIVEIMNEYLFATTGLFYPSSLLYFPSFKFPVALVLSSSFYTWVLYTVSRRIAIGLAGERSRFMRLYQLGVFLLLLLTNIVIEPVGVSIGYWQWRTTPPTTLVILAARYIDYFLFAFPPALFAVLFSRRCGTGPNA
jgi:hypothetical protein